MGQRDGSPRKTRGKHDEAAGGRVFHRLTQRHARTATKDTIVLIIGCGDDSEPKLFPGGGNHEVVPPDGCAPSTCRKAHRRAGSRPGVGAVGGQGVVVVEGVLRFIEVRVDVKANPVAIEIHMHHEGIGRIRLDDVIWAIGAAHAHFLHAPGGAAAALPKVEPLRAAIHRADAKVIPRRDSRPGGHIHAVIDILRHVRLTDRAVGLAEAIVFALRHRITRRDELSGVKRGCVGDHVPGGRRARSACWSRVLVIPKHTPVLRSNIPIRIVKRLHPNDLRTHRHRQKRPQNTHQKKPSLHKNETIKQTAFAPSAHP